MINKKAQIFHNEPLGSWKICAFFLILGFPPYPQ